MFDYSWGSTVRIKAGARSESERSLMKFLLKYAGKYSHALCLKTNATHILTMLTAITMCKKLESLCLRKKGRLTDDDADDPEYENNIGEILKNNGNIKQIF